MTENEAKQLADDLAPVCAQGKAAEVFSMSEDEAESYGAFEETALSEKELDDFFEKLLRDCFIDNAKEGVSK